MRTKEGIGPARTDSLSRLSSSSLRSLSVQNIRVEIPRSFIRWKSSSGIYGSGVAALYVGLFP